MKIDDILDAYAELYPAGLSDAEVEALAPSALAYIDVITAGRAQTATGYKLERVKMAVCAVINEIHAQEGVRNADGARLVSVSNDGYTETYGSVSVDASKAEAEAIRRTAFKWLSGTGLVSAL